MVGRFATIVAHLQPSCSDKAVCALSPAIGSSTSQFRDQRVFGDGLHRQMATYGAYGYVAIVVNGRLQPPIDDAPAKDGLVSTQSLSNETESVFGPGLALP